MAILSTKLSIAQPRLTVGSNCLQPKPRADVVHPASSTAVCKSLLLLAVQKSDLDRVTGYAEIRASGLWRSSRRGMALKIGVGLSPAPCIIEGQPWSSMLGLTCHWTARACASWMIRARSLKVEGGQRTGGADRLVGRTRAPLQLRDLTTPPDNAYSDAVGRQAVRSTTLSIEPLSRPSYAPGEMRAGRCPHPPAPRRKAQLSHALRLRDW